MKKEFWLSIWEDNIINFHKEDVNPGLVKYFHNLNLQKEDTILIPLCGKTKDIKFFLSQGYKVIGIELSEIAIDQLFEELKLTPQITQLKDFKLYKYENLEVYIGDIFKVTRKDLGPVNAIYDRAALVALPPQMRNQYTAHLTNITNKAQQLIIVVEYNQNDIAGPPFSISSEELKGHYESDYKIKRVESNLVPGGLKGKVQAHENIWYLV
jgi:thiopurine S-methyltransferase